MRKKTIVGPALTETGPKQRQKPGPSRKERPLCARPGCQEQVKRSKSIYCSPQCHGAVKYGVATRDPDSIRRGIETKRRNRQLALSGN